MFSKNADQSRGQEYCSFLASEEVEEAFLQATSKNREPIIAPDFRFVGEIHVEDFIAQSYIPAHRLQTRDIVTKGICYSIKYEMMKSNSKRGAKFLWRREEGSKMVFRNEILIHSVKF